MEKRMIEELVAKYNEGMADPAEVRKLEQLIEEGKVDLTSLRELYSLDEQVGKLEHEAPTMRLDHQFYEALNQEKLEQKKAKTVSMPSWNYLFPRLAAAAVLILSGFAAGYFMQTPAQKTEVTTLTREVNDLKEMMLLTLLERESASERLKAVSLSNEMDQVSNKVTDALFITLNQDENVNVRLAALEVLRTYSRNSSVRKKLIESITLQDSPLVQMELAQLMVSIQEKKSVNALRELLKNERTTQEVKNKVSESIKVLI